MLSLNEVALHRGPRKLLEAVSCTIYPGWRLGVIGNNGTGKSSLFALLLGELTTDAGTVRMPRGLVIATVAQETPALPDAAIDYVLDGDAELRLLERELAVAEAAHDGARIAELHERLATIEAYSAPARAARLLHGLGFSAVDQRRVVAEFSGGWRMRLNLARTLMRRSELLLLDEPTNHLDLDAVIWLQAWLGAYPGTLLVISHDREFLDTVTTHTLHLEHGSAQLYSGNYTQFERQRAERMAQRAAGYQKQQQRIAHLQSFVDRFRAQATKARQAQARMKMIERMVLLAPAHADSEFTFAFLSPHKLPEPLLRLDRVDAGYPQPDGALKPVLRGITLTLQPGARIGLLGRNGAGKSTLVRLLAGVLTPQSGERLPAPDLRIGYFAQHQVEQLDLGATPITHLQRLDPRAAEQDLRDYLGGFNFRGARAFEPIGPFSGGEKARLALALVVYQRPNLLLLDEPTNHLDLDMRQALETALQDYVGAMVLVSHDRHLLRSTCDALWLVAAGGCLPFDGDLDDYARWLASRATAAEADATAPAQPTSKDQRRAAAEQRERQRPLRNALKKWDAEMTALQHALHNLELRLADPALYVGTGKAELGTLTQQQTGLKQQLAAAEGHWLTAAEALETAAAIDNP